VEAELPVPVARPAVAGEPESAGSGNPGAGALGLLVAAATVVEQLGAWQQPAA